MKSFYAYIMASGRNGTLYAGSTSDLIKRTWEHKNNLTPGFTAKVTTHVIPSAPAPLGQTSEKTSVIPNAVRDLRLRHCAILRRSLAALGMTWVVTGQVQCAYIGLL